MYQVLVKWTGHRAAVQPGETSSGVGAVASLGTALRMRDVYRIGGHTARVVDAIGLEVSVSRLGQVALFGGGR